MSLNALLMEPSGISLGLLESELGVSVKKRKAEAAERKSTGTLKFAAQFIVDPETPAIKEIATIEQGVIKMHVIAVAGGRLSDPTQTTTKQKTYTKLAGEFLWYIWSCLIFCISNHISISCSECQHS